MNNLSEAVVCEIIRKQKYCKKGFAIMICGFCEITVNITIKFEISENFIDVNIKKKEVPTGAYQYNGHSYVIYEAQDEKLAEMSGKKFDNLVFQDVEDFCEEKGGIWL